MYGEVIYEDFLRFMQGQTIRTQGGEDFYYKHDIENYFRKNEERFFD